jgi:chemotaxis signal transduction protein
MIEIDDLIPHMRRVQGAERDMRDLSLTWQMIEASAAISCPDDVQSILPTLTQTRQRFDDLQQRLVTQLAAETLAELQDELVAKAQCAIDILVRNLYERTADVGFLATDDVLREFCAAGPDVRAAGHESVRRRLAEYRAKYSVYDDVIVFDAGGDLLVRLHDGAAVARSADPIVRSALQSRSYIEQYGRTDLADGDAALLYAHRIEDGQGRVLGVLVLRFRFADEMARIFASVADARNQFAIVLLDAGQRVVASNDEGHVPLGIRLPAVGDDAVNIVSFAGREYLAVACGTHGYQGYMGPGWRGYAMVSLLTAFRSRRTNDIDHAVSLDNAELVAVQDEASAINRNLRRVVWNGRLMARADGYDQARLKAVLTQVNHAGTRTRARVEQAVGDLHRTSLARTMHQASELARLAADVMDRNLYERANDCRWWALAPTLQAVLAAEADADADGAERLTAVLEHINSLYTVYARLVAFDAQGIVRAASRDDPARRLVGSRVEASMLNAVQALGDSQRYAVTPFAPSALSFGEPAYVFLAAVRAPATQRLAGGIAIVFNTVAELTAMLREVMGSRKGIAAFVDAEGRVIACSDGALGPGAVLPFGHSDGVVAYDGMHYAVVHVVASGYREFRAGDGYRNDVRAVVAMQLGRLERRRHAATVDDNASSVRQVDRARSLELAVVRVGAGTYALPADQVIEAVAPSTILRAPNAAPAVLGLIEARSRERPRILQLLSARRLLGVQAAERAGDGVALIIQAQSGQPVLSLWVDDVVSVVEVDRNAVQPPPLAAEAAGQLVSGLVELPGTGAGTLVQILDTTRLLDPVRVPATSASAVPAAATAVA